MSTSAQYENGRWYPTPPMKAPVDVRWCCEHDWQLHRHRSGQSSHVDFDCMNCGAETESGTWPPKVWSVRLWLAEHLFSYGRAVRRSRVR